MTRLNKYDDRMANSMVPKEVEKMFWIKCFMNSLIQRILFYFISVIFISTLQCCATLGPTKPNPVVTHYPGYDALVEMSPLLAYEIGRLPEIQDGISPAEAVSLKKLIELRDAEPAAFDKAFEKMYQVGIPEIRKYCSPLQAVFWLIEDGKIGDINISKCNIMNLINEAWLKSGFEYNDKKGRWKDFDIVTDRLNSPELIEFYIRWDFTHHSRLEEGFPAQTLFSLFKYKKGNCEDFSNFCVYCLKKAGYQAKMIRVTGRKRGNILHTACEYIDIDGKEYVIDVMTGREIFTKEGYLRNFKKR